MIISCSLTSIVEPVELELRFDVFTKEFPLLAAELGAKCPPRLVLVATARPKYRL